MRVSRCVCTYRKKHPRRFALSESDTKRSKGVFIVAAPPGSAAAGLSPDKVIRGTEVET